MLAVPKTAREIDAAWLGEALSLRHPGVSVANVELVALHEATNAHAKLRIAYDESSGAPETLFCKLLPSSDPARSAIVATGMGLSEARFYADLAPTLPLRTPTVHAVWHDPGSGAFVILMEDLQSTGCRVPDGVDGIPVDAAARALEDLASMHLAYRDPGRRSAEAPWVSPPGPPSEYGTSRLSFALEHHRERLTDPFAALADLYVRECAAIHELWHRGPQTVIHGDPHIGNLFLDGEVVGFLDWGLINLSTPLRDVSYFLAMALSIEDRRRDEERLLGHWLEVWNAGRGDALTFDEVWRAHRLHAAYTVPACCQIVTFPDAISPGRERFSRAFLARAEAAIEDLEALSVLAELGVH